MPIPFIVIGGLAVVAGWSLKEWLFPQAGMMSVEGRGMTPEQTAGYNEALRSKDPIHLRALAASYRMMGFAQEAALLEKRARLRELPPDVRRARRDAFRKAMSSIQIEGLEKFANALEQEGCTDAAIAIRERVESLRSIHPKT